MNTLFVVLALVADAVIGDPDRVWRRLPHPVVWFGRVIDILDRSLNRTDRSNVERRRAGVLTVVILLAGSALIGWAVQSALLFLPFGWILLVLIASVFLAQNSLYRHVDAVRSALETEGLEAGRKAVSMIVGRDPDSLDEAGVSRAAIESCAENFSDGVVAPAFWFALFGLPGLLAYKAINTADSMIGHRTPRHEDFGWAAARFDDLVNWPAARLSVFIIAFGSALTGGSPIKCLRTAWRDAPHHRSPNAGWPEAAFGAALNLALAGPRVYGDQTVDDALMNVTGRREANAADIASALRLLVFACGMQIIVYMTIALFI